MRQNKTSFGVQVLKRKIIFFFNVFKMEISKLEEAAEREETEGRKKEDNWWRRREAGRNRC